jgi:hypothetical protein
MVLDAACDGDPVLWAEQHEELSAAACEHIRYWEQQRASDQILDVLNGPGGGWSVESPAGEAASRGGAEEAEYCDAIDELISEAAASEIIRCLAHTHDAGLAAKYDVFVQQAVEQLSSPTSSDRDA